MRSGRTVQFSTEEPTALTAATYLGQRKPNLSNKKTKQTDTYQYLANGKLTQKVNAADLNSQFLHGLNWDECIQNISSFDSKRALTQFLQNYDEEEGTMEDWTPYALAAKANSEDIPNWYEAMNGPDREGFWEACRIEIETLKRMKVWDEVKREPWMNVLPSTWAFRRKRYPDGLIKKLKARWCCRGDRQVKDVDFFDTFALY